MERAGRMSQSKLARAIGVKPQAIQYLLNPANGATGSKHVFAIAKTLNVSPTWLGGGAAEMLSYIDPELLKSTERAQEQAPPPVEQLVDQLAQVLCNLPEESRSQVSPLLQALCLAPDSETLKNRLLKLLKRTMNA